VSRFRLPLVLTAVLFGCASVRAEPASDPRIEALLGRMTIEEKVGQLNMVSFVPTHEEKFAPIDRALGAGVVGAMFNVHGLETARGLQARAARSRLGIPLLLALDVVHGYRTIFPTPLAQAASFDMEAIRLSERIASAEAAADGVNLLLTPMLDVSRDARWGRIVEGPGESVHLAARIAEARVSGIQEGGLGSNRATAACVKHFGATGAVEGGRDYTAADLSDRAMRETYLPPFRAAVAAGAACMMSAFNAPDGAPTIANRRLLTEVLRAQWGFDGVVTSDFEAIQELVAHGHAADEADAARAAFDAGADIDMQSNAFIETLPSAVREGAVSERALDAAVRRVLTLKARLGLFDDSSRGVRAAPAEGPPPPQHLAAAQDLAEKSVVLLKNERRTLPVSADVKSVALIGPLGDSAADTLGPWAGRGEPSETVTLKMGLERRLGPGVEFAFTPGGSAAASRDDEIDAAVETARRAEMVVLALGERFDQSGEAASRADLGLPGDQAKLARAVLALGKPTVAVIFAGRPLVLTELAEAAPAILYAWQPGTMGGAALARVLMGDVAPSGRLPMTLPRSVGQVPIHHDMRPTGRPYDPADPYTTGYRDSPYAPLYPFGHGLSYTDFAFGSPKPARSVLRLGEAQTVSVSVTNTGGRPGVAVAQLYVRPRVARVAQPLKQLRGFARVELAPGETRTVDLPLSPDDFGYWRDGDTFEIPAGAIEVMTGADAAETTSATFEYRP
jgi:beta-glucosidase